MTYQAWLSQTTPLQNNSCAKTVTADPTRAGVQC
jgi:hypothetical protein